MAVQGPRPLQMALLSGRKVVCLFRTLTLSIQKLPLWNSSFIATFRSLQFCPTVNAVNTDNRKTNFSLTFSKDQNDKLLGHKLCVLKQRSSGSHCSDKEATVTPAFQDHVPMRSHLPWLGSSRYLSVRALRTFPVWGTDGSMPGRHAGPAPFHRSLCLVSGWWLSVLLHLLGCVWLILEAMTSSLSLSSLKLSSTLGSRCVNADFNKYLCHPSANPHIARNRLFNYEIEISTYFSYLDFLLFHCKASLG